MTDLYTPPQEILKPLDMDSNSIHQQTTFPGNISESTLTTYLDSFLLLIMAHYNKKQIDLRSKTRFTSDISNVAIEGLLNSKQHGSRSQTTPFSHIVLIGNNGVCQGFHDEGGFYLRPEIKKTLEAKERLEEVNPLNHEGIHAGIYAYIYPKCNLIYVDNERGVLYCAHLINPQEQLPPKP